MQKKKRSDGIFFYWRANLESQYNVWYDWVFNNIWLIKNLVYKVKCCAFRWKFSGHHRKPLNPRTSEKEKGTCSILWRSRKQQLKKKKIELRRVFKFRSPIETYLHASGPASRGKSAKLITCASIRILRIKEVNPRIWTYSYILIQAAQPFVLPACATLTSLQWVRRRGIMVSVG